MKAEKVKNVLSCEEFAALNQVKGQTVRARICRFGSYFGIKPMKLLNGRLAFPALQVERLSEQ